MLGRLARQHDPNVLIGYDTADDAGVYLVAPEVAPNLALVQTVDFFTPIVDDPFTFGQIAATNALSDVYAMGGRPVCALALVCFPEKGDLDVLERIMAGGLDKMMEAGCTVIGGHSIRDPEIKFGYAVTGTVDRSRVLTNAGARPGDRLVLSKALGTGVISTAIKQGRAEDVWIEAATRSMTTLNRTAAEIALRYKVHAATDVTGFGLIGHARELAAASKVTLRIAASAAPLLPGAMECVERGFIPGGLKNNRDFAECAVAYDPSLPEDLRTILYDPQTSGGLLLSVSATQADQLTAELKHAGLPAALIGWVCERGEKPIELLGT